MELVGVGRRSMTLEYSFKVEGALRGVWIEKNKGKTIDQRRKDVGAALREAKIE